MHSAEIVIIGGGVIGASIAYHLAAKGCRNILLLDRHPEPGMGSTARGAGGFRSQFDSEILVRLSLLSREKLRRFLDEVGVSAEYRPVGSLFLVHTREQEEIFDQALLIQRCAGLLEVRKLNPQEVRQINPAVSGENLLAGFFCPTDGLVRPMEILRGYLEAAEWLGVKMEFDCDVFEIHRQNNIVTGLKTSSGEIIAGAFVNAAGPWSGHLAELADVKLPVHPVRRQAAVTRFSRLLPDQLPITVFAEDRFQFLVRNGRLLMLQPERLEPIDPNHVEVSDYWLQQMRKLGQARINTPAEITIDKRGSWAGLFELSPDRHPIIGKAPGLDNFYVASGCSGMGVMHSPALGLLMSEIIADGSAHTIDAYPFRAERFTERRLNHCSPSFTF